MTIAYYVGGTGTGKTTLMCEHGVGRAAERAVPVMLLDSEGVVGRDKVDAVTAPDVESALSLLYVEGRHVRFVPKDQEEVGALARGIRAGGDCVFLVDEVSYWARGGVIVEDLARLYRVHRHSRVDIYSTSQYPADIAPLIWNVKTEVYIFRNESMAAVERLSKECWLSKEQAASVPTLPDMKYIPWRSRGNSPLAP